MNKVVVINKSTKVFLYNKATNMACSFPKLVEYIEKSDIPEHQLVQGNLFLFVNKKQNYIKVLFKVHDDFLILAKRLEHGKFLVDIAKGSISAAELDKLLMNGVKRKLLKQ